MSHSAYQKLNNEMQALVSNASNRELLQFVRSGDEATFLGGIYSQLTSSPTSRSTGAQRTSRSLLDTGRIDSQRIAGGTQVSNGTSSQLPPTTPTPPLRVLQVERLILEDLSLTEWDTNTSSQDSLISSTSDYVSTLRAGRPLSPANVPTRSSERFPLTVGPRCPPRVPLRRPEFGGCLTSSGATKQKKLSTLEKGLKRKCTELTTSSSRTSPLSPLATPTCSRSTLCPPTKSTTQSTCVERPMVLGTARVPVLSQLTKRDAFKLTLPTLVIPSNNANLRTPISCSRSVPRRLAKRLFTNDSHRSRGDCRFLRNSIGESQSEQTVRIEAEWSAMDEDFWPQVTVTKR